MLLAVLLPCSRAGASDRSRVQQFLASTLASSTRERYSAALAAFNFECQQRGVSFSTLPEEEQDWLLAERIFEGFEAGESRGFFAALLSALLKGDPRLRLKVAWRALDVWNVREPARQAPACPPEVLLGMMVLAVLLGQPVLGTAMMVAYAGLLRISEALNLCGRDVFLSAGSVTLCLGRTKRGLEEKVVLTHPGTVAWFSAYVVRHPVLPHKRLFSCSYGRVLTWLKALSTAMGFGAWHLTTHSLRRSGATELARVGLPLADILLFGRWRSERSAREYIRRGQVAIVRAQGGAFVKELQLARSWASLAPTVWALHDARVLLEVGPALVTPELLQRFEQLLRLSSAHPCRQAA